MDNDDELEEQIEIKKVFTEELLKQIDTWNQKLRELDIPLKVDLKFIDEL
ncbi:hypothetical protein [Paenimyroides baculatum]|nr:hypothetical protein [Paenimyroides baculatum]